MKFYVAKKKNLIIFCLIGLIITASIVGSSVIPTFSKKRLLPIYSVERNDKKIAITFDCAWGTDYTDELLSIMQDKGVKSTFFTVKFWTEKHPDYVKKIFDMGHELGTHSSTHPNMSKLNKDQIIQELSNSKKAIEDITGQTVKVFRPPFGDYNDLLIATAEELSLKTIQWSVDSLDWKDLSSTQIYQRVTSKVGDGAIVLFHNNGLNTAKALPKIIDKLLSDGYQFVTVSQLIYFDNYYIDNNGRQHLR
jgi:polysaccharide deacetylase family sporulation protein PdaB